MSIIYIRVLTLLGVLGICLLLYIASFCNYDSDTLEVSKKSLTVAFTGKLLDISKKYAVFTAMPLFIMLILQCTLKSVLASQLSLVFAVYWGIALIDCTKLVVPDVGLLVLICCSVMQVTSITDLLLGLLSGGVYCALLLLMFIITKGNAVGFGDCVLLFCIGCIMRLNLYFYYVLVLGVCCFVICIIYLVFKALGRDYKNTQIPFVPVLTMSSFLVLLCYAFM